MNRTINPYTLHIYGPEIYAAARLDKKTRGAGRTITRLVHRIASHKSTIEGYETIDFTLGVHHFNPAGNLVPDWYARLCAEEPGLAPYIQFQKIALQVVYGRLVYWNSLQGESMEKAKFHAVYRFEQVCTPASGDCVNKVVLRLPVMTVIVPEDFDALSVGEKVDFIGLVAEMSRKYSADDLTIGFKNAHKRETSDDILRDMKCWRIAHDLDCGRIKITNSYTTAEIGGDLKEQLRYQVMNHAVDRINEFPAG
jgi:hypothetical protein